MLSSILSQCPIRDYLLCILKRARANVAFALQRILVVVVDALVLHAAAVGSEDGAALPSTDVRLDTGVRVEMSLHVRLIAKSRSISTRGKKYVQP